MFHRSNINSWETLPEGGGLLRSQGYYDQMDFQPHTAGRTNQLILEPWNTGKLFFACEENTLGRWFSLYSVPPLSWSLDLTISYQTEKQGLLLHLAEGTQEEHL